MKIEYLIDQPKIVFYYKDNEYISLNFIDNNSYHMDIVENSFVINLSDNKKCIIKEESDIEMLDSLKDSKDYIDLVISNNLIVSNRKLRRKLETLLESGNFATVEYLDDIVKSTEDIKELTEEELDISMQLDYEEVIRKYISGQVYGSDKFRNGVMGEFDEIIKSYNDGFRNNNV